MTLRELLTQHGLTAYVAAFEAEHLTLEDLPSLTDEDLRGTLGMTALMDRKRLRAAVATLAGTTPTLEGATRVEPPPSGHPPSLAGATHLDAGALPQRLGSYRVLGMLGAGGMGTVVRARHMEEGWAQRQGGDVAIKLVHAHLASDATFRDRFFSEAELGRRVMHPGLVQIWDVVAEGPWLGTVMSLVGGESLSSRVRAGGLPVEEVATLLGPIGAALDHLHAQGIVHRDVKPANVVVRPDGGAVLLDLGIAKDTTVGEGHTRTMTTMGTSAWMAPEQADAKRVDGAADRYAFGLMAYALVSGRMPWDEGTSEPRVFANKLTGQLVPLAQARAGLPEGVYAAVTRMLALSPGERLETCAALVDGLRHAEADAVRVRAEREQAAARAMREREQSTAREREARERANHARREREAQEARAAEQRAARARDEIDRRWPVATPEHVGGAAPLRYEVSRTTSGFLGFGRKVVNTSFSMVVVPPCRFIMGSPPVEAGRDSAEVQHEVRLSRAYAIATTPVTQALLTTVTGANPSDFAQGADAMQRPVDRVSWFDAVRFCNALSAKVGLRPAYRIGAGDEPSVKPDWVADGFRLPTEAVSWFSVKWKTDGLKLCGNRREAEAL